MNIDNAENKLVSHVKIAEINFGKESLAKKLVRKVRGKIERTEDSGKIGGTLKKVFGFLFRGKKRFEGPKEK